MGGILRSRLETVRCSVKIWAILAVFGVQLPAQSPTCGGMGLGVGASLNGFVPFSPASPWNTDISGAPVDSNSANIIHYIGASTTLHPDFGSGMYAGQAIGIPYQVEAGAQPKVQVTITGYTSESDPGPMPIPAYALIEGYPIPGDGDRHVLVLDRDGCWLYELYNSHGPRLFPVRRFRPMVQASNGWTADSTAIWDMTIVEQRPYSWTSADAAGLPIFVGLARYDEVAAGAIRHALRFTVPTTRQAFVAPASHWASSTADPNAPPMGARLRLQATFDISRFSADNQVILTAMKKYGLILADNGSAIDIGGAPDSRWNNDDLGNLRSVTASDFDVVQMGTIYTPTNVPTGSSPAIGGITANPATIHSGMSSMLTWTVTDATYTIVSPDVGPVRGTAAMVTPAATATYTLYATNQYGRTTQTVTVTVK